MIRLTVNEAQHVEDGDIIRLIDGECLPAEEQLIREHLETCAECKRAADELGLLAETFSRVLAQTDTSPSASAIGTTPSTDAKIIPLPARNWTRVRVLKAAAVVTLVATAIGVSPARAWLVDGWQALRSIFVEEAVDPTEVPAPVEVPDITAVVTFRPAGTSLTIEVSSAQALGTIALLSGPGLSASARVLGGGGGEELVVLPDALRIANASTSTASYEIVVPRSVRMVAVTIAGRSVLTMDAAELSEAVAREIELGPLTRP